MGSGHSVRRLTIDNEEIGVIEISESVVERLMQQMNKPNTVDVNEVRSSTLMEPSSKRGLSELPPSGDASANYDYAMHHPQLTLTALKIQQQLQQELHDQNNYWQKRLENLKRMHSRIDEIIDGEYKKATEQLYSNAKKTVNIQDTIQPCQDSAGKVLKCYQDHPKEILKCSTLLEEFSNCVDERRARVIAARC